MRGGLRFGISAATLVTVLALANAASAQDIPPEAAADMQCMAVLVAASDNEALTPEVRQGFMASMMFYLGRLEGRDPETAWLERLTAYLVRVEAKDIQAHAPRCGHELMEKGELLQTWGRRIIEKGEHLSD